MLRLCLTLFSVIVLVPSALFGQNTLFVRSTGNDANDGTSESSAKKTIAAAIASAQSGDVVDVGVGSFAGATVNKSLVIQGANANNALELWGQPTVMTSTLTLDRSAAGMVVTFIGLQFGPITPISGECPNANVTVYNCKFLGSKSFTTTRSGWAELFLTASVFEAKAEGSKPGSQAASSAITGGDVGVMVVRENTFRDYTKSALDVSGTGQIVRLSYNEFTNCNTSKDPSQGAIRVDATSIEQELTIENSLFTGCATSVVTSGALTGKTVTLQRNSFRQTPSPLPAIKNLSANTLDATCNAFNVPTKEKDKTVSVDVIAASIEKLLSGPVTVSPTNLDGTDADGNAIGFEPEKGAVCSGILK
jgi:hypothetical protein